MKILRDTVKKDVYMVQKVLNMLRRGELRKDHPQQRKAQQWDNSTRDGFIATCIKNENFDSVKICEQITPNGVVLWLIDGLQRLSTLDMYKNNAFALGKCIEYPIIEYQVAELDENGNFVYDEDGCQSYKIVEFDLRGKRYNDLPEELKENFDNCPIDVVKHLDCSDEMVGYNIRRYNSCCKMNVAQSAVTYMDNVARDIKKLSSHDFFLDCANFSETQRKRGEIDKTVSESVMAINFWDSWNRNAKIIGTRLNENATIEMFEKFGEYLDRLIEVVNGEATKLFNGKNSVLWFMLFDRFNKLNVEDKYFGEFLNKFTDELHSKEVNGTSFDVIDSGRSTKDKGILENKLAILETLMIEFLHIKKEYIEIENKSEFIKNVKSDVENNTLDDIEVSKEFIADLYDTDLVSVSNVSKDDMDYIARATVLLTGKKESDILIYAEDVNDYLQNSVKDYENILNRETIPALIGYLAYAYENDIEDDELNQMLILLAKSSSKTLNFLGFYELLISKNQKAA